MSFLFTSLLYVGLPLVAIPVAIHLINLRRQRLIRWAAMEFLLASQKRHRKWIFLKQLLLLLIRMAAVAAVAIMVAQPVLRSEWGDLLGGTTTHHLVLLDDSYSMTDRLGELSAFDRAKNVVQMIADRAEREGGDQLFTMIRFSEARELTAGSLPTALRETIDNNFTGRIESMLGGFDASETAAGPDDAIEALARLPKQEKDEALVVYLVTDFRQRDWDRADQLRRRLIEIQGEGVQLRFVNCAPQMHPNLAITALTPRYGLRAARVEIWMELTVANYGDTAQKGVTVELAEDGHPRAAIDLEAIPPGETITRRFRVNFPTAGYHSVSATLPADAVAADNRRFYSADIPDVVRILVIDGSDTGRDGRAASTALAPGGSVTTGWQPVVEPPVYLRREDALAKYAAVLLLDVARLDQPEIELLESFVRDGGGLAFFLGDKTDRMHVNLDWHRGGEGMFPAMLRLPTQLLPAGDEAGPDVVFADHPVFSVFSGERNSFLKMLLVDYYYSLDQSWRPAVESQTSVIARVRNGDPFVVEKRLGAGRVLAVLTKASPEKTSLGAWNNWALNPAFPVVMNEMVAYLTANWHRVPGRIVGEPLDVVFDEADFTANVRFSVQLDETPTVLPVVASAKDGLLTARLPRVDRSGLYEAQLVRRDGAQPRRLYAFNVPGREGDLHVMPVEELTARLDGVRFRYHDATRFANESSELAGLPLAESIFYALVVLLLVEQVLAYLFSFHSKPISMNR